MTTNILPIFWNLASSSKDTRIPASAELISSLEGFQRSYLETKGDKEDSSEDEDDDEKDDEDDDEEDSDAESGIEVDGDEDMDEAPQDGEAKALDKALDKENADDVVYAVKRLIRGLGSSRDSSRLGFAVALTELLARISSVSPAQAISLLLRSSQTSKANKGQENRDFLFARLFGLTAIVNSGALFVSTANIDDFRVVTGELVGLGRKKGWLKESAWYTLISAVEGLLSSEASWAEEALTEVVDKAYGREAEGGWSSEKVALTLLLEQKRPKLDWKTLLAPTFKHTPLLHSSNLVTLAPILKGSDVEDDEEDSGIASTGAWKPQPHFVWNIILDRYFSPASTVAAKQAPFQDFFRVVVDESLFNNSSSSERKYWGFSIILMSLPLLPADLLPQIFTPNFMRSWINNLSAQDRYLHKAAMQIAQALQVTVKSNPTVGFTLLSQLVGKHGRPDFDKVTKTKLVEAIMGNLSSEGVKEYVAYLQGVVMGADEKNGADIKTMQDRRHWALDQLLALCRNNSVPKGDDWVSSVLEFLLVHGFFNTKKADKKSSIVALQSVARPPLSEATAAVCRARFFSCILEITTATVPINKAEPTQPKLQQGCDASGRLWLSRLLDTLSTLEKDTKHVEAILDTDDEIRRIRQSAQKTIGEITKLKTEKGDMASGAEILLAFLILQTHDESDDALDLLEETNNAVRQLFSLDPSSSSATESLPVDRVLDTLVALLDKNSSDLRNLANLVAGLFSSAFTKSSIEHLNAQLESTAAESVEVDEEDADGIDEEMNSGSASDDDEDEESEAESDDAEEDDEVMGDVDPAFRARVAEALQVSGMGVESKGDGDSSDDDSESDGEVWDDEQMLKVDEQLAAVFRDRATASSGKKVDKNLQTESIHFKARILDLYEVFAKKQPTNPLVIELLLPLLNITKNSGNAAAALSNKASSLIRSRFTKPKDLPLNLSAQAGKEALEGIHDLARKSYSGEFTALCSICSVFVARAMDANNSDKQVVEVYSKTLEEYMTHKATQLHATFLNDYFKRHAIRAWPLHSTLVKFLNPGKAINIYRQTVAYELLAQLAPQLPTISKTHQKEVEALIPQAIEAFYATLESAKEDEGWKADKLKDFLKPMLAFARATKVMGYEWDLERLDKVIEGTNDTRLGGLKSVTSMLAQLRAVIAKGGKGEVKTVKGDKPAKGEKSSKGDKSSKTKGEVKANGSTKKSKKRSNGEMTEDVEMAEPTTDSLPPVIAPPKKRKESSDSKSSKSKKAKTPKA